MAGSARGYNGSCDRDATPQSVAVAYMQTHNGNIQKYIFLHKRPIIMSHIDGIL